VLKPAEQSSAVAAELFRAFLDAGLPAEAAAFLPGGGEDVGAYLVNSPQVATIAFTGSKAVGLQIIAAAAVVSPGQEHVKRVIAEMGSKNAIIVDDDADLDAAVKGVVASAFGYAGQKCSACSRVIVLEAVYDRFLGRLAEAARSLIVGPSTDPATVVGPVIDRDAQERLLHTIENAGQTCRLVAQGNCPAGLEHGLYVPPAVFTDVPAGHELLTKELFGPVLAVVKASDFDAALAMAMDTEYGLTGAVFSRSPSNLRKAVRDFRVGNLYLNRGCTGALVGRQPFGGARMSGVGSKAGGPDYLLQFVVPRSISESTFRKGFAPMAD
jgi:RHH-type proline utilization regulon transcriptional repressor/proline dehydrogenase/delta 1-pyrroline-5-carboxylate dehydrogenase